MNVKERFYKAIRYLKIIKFLFIEKTTGLFDNILLRLGVPDNSLRFKGHHSKKRIVFAGQSMNFRTIKNIKWLKSSGLFEIIVVCHNSFQKENLLESYYDKLVEFRNETHLRRIIAASENVDLFFAISPKSNYSKIVISYAHAPAILDAYDCMVMYHGKTSSLKWLSKELLDEEYCFQNASAITARSPEEYLARKMFNARKRPSLFFADYSDNDYFVNEPKRLTVQDNKISIVYSGGIHGKHLKNKISQGLTDFYSLIEHFEEQKVDFHIYPSPFMSIENYYDYLELAERATYFHMHPSIPQRDLSKELSNYHFGILPHFRTGESKITDDKLERATSLKFYNYLEAGIPILVSSEMVYMSWLIKRYSLGIVFEKKDFPEIRNLILRHDYEKLKANVLAMRDKLSMRKNLPRLIGFINELMEKDARERK